MIKTDTTEKGLEA